MKKIPQNILILIGCVVVVLVVVAVFGMFSTSMPLSRQVIHIHDDPSLKLSNPNGLLKISEMKPNSMTWFWYPDPDRFKDRDPFEKFLLIRLPDYLGGSVNDASAFRAYSAIDPSSHCIVKYWPEEGRRRIEDPCGGNSYEPVRGHVIEIQGNPVLVSKNFALPYLQLSSDERGYLYVEPPVFTEHKNGVIAIGRTISQQEIDETNKFIETREKQIRDAMEKFVVPDQFSTGHKLDQIIDKGIRAKTAYYIHHDSTQSQIFLYYEYCNCTKTAGLLFNEESRSGSQLVELNDISIVATPNTMNYVSDIHGDYTFVFYNNGYKTSLHTNQRLDSGLNLVKELLEFANKNQTSSYEVWTTQGPITVEIDRITNTVISISSNDLNYQDRVLIEENQKKIIQTVLSNAEIEKLIKGKDYIIFSVRHHGVGCEACVCPEEGCALVGFSTVKSQNVGVTMTVILNPITGEIFDIRTSQAWDQD